MSGGSPSGHLSPRPATSAFARGPSTDGATGRINLVRVRSWIRARSISSPPMTSNLPLRQRSHARIVHGVRMEDRGYVVALYIQVSVSVVSLLTKYASPIPINYGGDVQLTRFTDLARRLVMRLAVIEPAEAASSRTTHRVAEDVEVPYAHAATAVARPHVLGVVDTRRGRGGGVTITEFGREVSIGWLAQQRDGGAQEVIECADIIPARSATDVASGQRWPERGRLSSRNGTPSRWLISPPPLPGQSSSP